MWRLLDIAGKEVSKSIKELEALKKTYESKYLVPYQQNYSMVENRKRKFIWVY